jgi:predicted transcriptional regulator
VKKYSSNAEEARITLDLLNAVEANSSVTQRSVAQELGIALGLTNTYLKRCVRKGYIKAKQIPANRYAYYLTPKGFAEKSRLAGEYLSISFNFFRASREQCAAAFEECAERRWTRVALAGCGDLAEIATLCVRDTPEIEIIGIIGTGSSQDGPEGEFAGLPVVKHLTELSKVHAVMVTDIVEAQRVFDELGRTIPPERVLTIPLLKVSRVQPRLADD